MSLIAHLDADCFYVSAERVRHPGLKGKPVGVIGNQGACVIAKSYEMRKTGVKTGEAIWEALKKCPDGIYLKRDFRWYEALSKRMLGMVRERHPMTEYYSIDEFFFQIEKPERARDLQLLILRDAGLPVTVGVARSRTLAKLFSDTAKPFGVRVVTDVATERELLAKLSVQEISGIADRSGKKLAERGINTCLDFAAADRRLIRSLLTKTGEDLWWELNGHKVQPIRPDRPQHQFISRGGSIGGASGDENKIRGWLARNTERLVEELDYHEVRPGRLTLALSVKEGESVGEDVRLESHTRRFDLLMAASARMLDRVWRPGLIVSHMHLIAGDLRRDGFVQRSLFDPPDEPESSLAVAKKEINDKIGRFAVRSAATLHIPEMYRDRSHEFDVCDIRGKICF
ncbi:DNA polymerase Y family protein [Zavarzinella formosa]|uniref:DNA polymerase Y family protein n=1 Tax=Zavarzinella formosa TaxID=360055 RepID=UPI0002DCFB38|nr:hypothetical protein [Zavarzinella formosa]